jgi:hypothetical protein
MIPASVLHLFPGVPQDVLHVQQKNLNTQKTPGFILGLELNFGQVQLSSGGGGGFLCPGIFESFTSSFTS